ncbi:MAG TPA: hypothetical protein EYP58_05450 [bacterium (Candidatus Stahlbacteria)]|nr:hypothetical protein [Candidatus Stahlbacteria bacterium]
MKIRVYGLGINESNQLKKRAKKFANAENLIKEINIIFTDCNYMKKLNKQFLGRNYVTDVLSFDIDDVGEIYVLLEDNLEVEKLWMKVLHGLLHLKGYDHQTKKQKAAMDKKAKLYRSC